ncbi:hypothetical protein COU78_04675 [Candidatus Peregrinibacteria bacterium CG10_big_fil_rev_8_21_14_0_10_49_24]|nr:MAG: hypothetical protein COV83_03820 [Candidatus Peregrinibacteria bacterium CG11_big_fil_rev_8_21_14_0_20_49_14]PIR50646.1 MAG: hypothetical protein COU78_04675 [Candidatus Peregrinibacteria bacterium CG10_big_fil_rev_8_21_14_0_10_49_24]PJA67730.1 MAG: hypothetical protein CO157_02965 [Candidatus Peregrinibacteria bacterium CG_4_9_14_3_um_filter_49_12]
MHRDQRNFLPLITIVLALVLLSSVLMGLHAPTSLGDGIRHHTLASLLTKNGVRSFGGWGDILYGGYFRLHNSDPWFLTHVILMPLGGFESIVAQRIFIVLSISLLSLALLYAMSNLHLSPTTKSVLLVLLLLGHVQFSMRLLIGRPLILMVALSIVVWSTALQKKAVASGVLLAIATLLSHLFLFPFFIVVCAGVWLWTLHDKRSAIEMLVAGATGVAAGFALHPQSMEYMHFFFTVFLRIPFMQNLPLGTELQSGIGRMAAPIALAGAAILLAYYASHACGITKKQLHEKGISLTAFIACVFLLGMCMWVRMLDFLWPVLIVLLAQLLSLQTDMAAKAAKDLLPSFAVRNHVPLLILLLVVGVNMGKMHYSFRSTDLERMLTHYSAPLESIPSGAAVLNIDWDLFPALFTVRPDLRFARGMDPSLDFVANPKVTGLLLAVRSSQPEKIDWESWERDLAALYPSDYLVIRIPEHVRVLPYLQSLTSLTEVSSGEQIAVFRMSHS